MCPALAGHVAVDPKFSVSARDLLFNDGRGGSLADRIPTGADSDGTDTVGTGCFGKVVSFLYNGVPVAVKELKGGAGDVSISKSVRLDQCCPRSSRLMPSGECAPTR